MPTPMLRRFCVAALFIAVTAGALSLAMLGLRALPANKAEAAFGIADSAPQTIAEVAIDMNTAGNTPNGLIPSVEACNVVAIGGTLDIDIVVDEVDPADTVSAIQATLNYTGAGAGAVNVTGVNNAGMMIAANGASQPMGMNEPTPDDGDGTYMAAAMDSASPPAHEWGEGVLHRITLTGVGPAGLSALSLSGVIVMADIGPLSGMAIPITTLTPAIVAVGVPCPAPTPPPQVCDSFPSADSDIFDYSGAEVTIEVEPAFGGGTETLVLEGPATIDRSDPGDGNPGAEQLGPDATEPDLLTDIETEMVSMTLTGNSGLFGAVTLRESPSRDSNGAIETVQGTGSDFPADSFFDVFFEMDIGPPLNVTAFNPVAFHMEERIRCIPPEGGGYQPRMDEPQFTDIYIDLDGDPAPPNDNLMRFGRIIHARHIPLPEKPLFSVRPGGPSGLNPADIYTITAVGAAPSVCVTDAALGISGAGGDDLNAHSLTESSSAVRDIRFTVDAASLGSPGTGVNAEATKLPPEAEGDEFNVPASGTNALFMDQSMFGLLTGDDIDALAEPPPGGCPPGPQAVAFSLATGSPALVAAAATAADVLVPPGTPGCAGPSPCVSVAGAALGLVGGDDLDALCWYDLNSDDLPDPSDSYLFSLSPASPSLGTIPANPDDLLAMGPAVYMTAPALGLRGAAGPDNLDGMKCPLGTVPAGPPPDGDGDGVTDPIDNCPDDPNPDQADTADGDGIGDVCEDSDGDGRMDAVDGCPFTVTAWRTPIGDSDCDGFTDDEEGFVGTDAADACPDDPDDDAWPADLVHTTLGYGKHDGKVNILDIVQLTPPYFNTSPPDPNYSTRKDFNGDNKINILDIVRVTPPTFNTSCTP